VATITKDGGAAGIILFRSHCLAASFWICVLSKILHL